MVLNQPECYLRRSLLILKGSPLIQKTTPTQMLGGPVFEANLELLKTISTIFRLAVSNIEILKIGNIQSISFNFIMPFHILASTVAHCLSQEQQNRRGKFVDSRNPSQSESVAFSKEATLASYLRVSHSLFTVF